MQDDMNITTLAETENYSAWKSDEPDGEAVFHFELGQVTLHLFQEEADELFELIAQARRSLGQK